MEKLRNLLPSAAPLTGIAHEAMGAAKKRAQDAVAGVAEAARKESQDAAAGAVEAARKRAQDTAAAVASAAKEQVAHQAVSVLNSDAVKRALALVPLIDRLKKLAENKTLGPDELRESVLRIIEEAKALPQ